MAQIVILIEEKNWWSKNRKVVLKNLKPSLIEDRVLVIYSYHNVYVYVLSHVSTTVHVFPSCS